MSELITLITCTGFRQEAFALCRKYFKRQTYKGPLQWIVISDQHKQSELDEIKDKYPECEMYAGPQIWQVDLNTQRGNTLEALKYVKGDKVIIFEDDDWYSPTYLQEMVDLLDHAPIVGEANSKYYHIGLPGWKENHNVGHSSLCQTGIRKELLPHLKLAVDSGELYFDIHLWRQVREQKIPHILFAEKNLCIGIKGMPGRTGIGSGHKIKDYFLDPNLVKLKEWLGADAANYFPFIERIKNERRANTTTTNGASTGQRNAGQLPKAITGSNQSNARSQSATKPVTVTQQNRRDISTSKPVVGARVGTDGDKSATKR